MLSSCSYTSVVRLSSLCLLWKLQKPLAWLRDLDYSPQPLSWRLCVFSLSWAQLLGSGSLESKSKLKLGANNKESACNAADPGSIPELEDPLEEELATHSSILARRTPWTEKSGGMQSVGLQKSQTWLTTEHAIRCDRSGWAIKSKIKKILFKDRALLSRNLVDTSGSLWSFMLTLDHCMQLDQCIKNNHLPLGFKNRPALWCLHCSLMKDNDIEGSNTISGETQLSFSTCCCFGERGGPFFVSHSAAWTAHGL